jgi:hypothetical protein
MKSTKKQKKLVLATETIKVLDSRRLAELAGGAYTYTCPPATQHPIFTINCHG